jgi:hypothetical protein
MNVHIFKALQVYPIQPIVKCHQCVVIHQLRNIKLLWNSVRFIHLHRLRRVEWEDNYEDELELMYKERAMLGSEIRIWGLRNVKQYCQLLSYEV